MPAVRVSSNRIRFPAGWKLYPIRPPYTFPTNGPGVVALGAFQSLVVASVPADLSTLILNAPDGKAYLFQFVYNASVQTLGIKVPLPASGGSTAAQVTTALLTVLAAGSGTPIGGAATSFPWLAAQTAATHLDVEYTIKGTAGAPTGTQATITNTTTPQSSGTAATVPGQVGPLSALLPGN